jgi:hypothetical protein
MEDFEASPIVYRAMGLRAKIRHRSNRTPIMKKTTRNGIEGVEFVSTTAGIGPVFWSRATGAIDACTGFKLPLSEVGLGNLSAACALLDAPPPPPAPSPADDDVIDIYGGLTSTDYPA